MTGFLSQVYSQTPKLTAAYINAGIGYGTNNGTFGGIGANVEFSNRWGLAYDHVTQSQKARSLPNDYEQCALSASGECGSTDDVYIKSLRISRIFLSPEKKIKFGLEAGPSKVRFATASFTPLTTSGSGFFGSNYETNYKYQYAPGLSFRAKMDLLISKFVGLQFAFNTNINQFQSYTGGEIHLTIGFLRKSIKPKLKKV